MVICLERGADLHMAQLMSLPLTVSCFSKIQIGFTFLVPAHPGSPGKGPLNVCVCVCVCVCVYRLTLLKRAATFAAILRQFATATVAALNLAVPRQKLNSRICRYACFLARASSARLRTLALKYLSFMTAERNRRGKWLVCLSRVRIASYHIRTKLAECCYSEHAYFSGNVHTH